MESQNNQHGGTGKTPLWRRAPRSSVWILCGPCGLARPRQHAPTMLAAGGKTPTCTSRPFQLLKNSELASCVSGEEQARVATGHWSSDRASGQRKPQQHDIGILGH
ncbi:hypothetical protein Q8A73_012713 [Channa argus]|nr:hypothetical protein Q8A73_012713 [Channa argus]